MPGRCRCYLVAQLKLIWPFDRIESARRELLSVTDPTALQFHSELNLPEQPLHSRGVGFKLDGDFYPTKNGVDTLRLVFEELSLRDQTFQGRFVNQEHGKTRRYLSADRNQLYERLDLCEIYSIQLRSEWWMSTNHSIGTIETIIQLACNVAGVKYGVHLVPQLRAES